MPILTALVTSLVMTAPAPPADPPLRPVPAHDVTLTGFWGARLATNRRVTLPHVLDECERTGRLRNFAAAAGRIDAPFEGLFFNDSDVYKIIQGACLALRAAPDDALRARIDAIVSDIVAAQMEDGYLNTYVQLAAPDERWANIRDRHELYCAGHLFEAAVAHHAATGTRTLLDVAVRFADHIDRIFGPGRRTEPPGHPEIEIGLIALADATGDRRYLDLAAFLIDARGRTEGRESYGAYAQDHQPVAAQTEAVGHAVRAAYLFTGMADLAMRVDRPDDVAALDRLWANVVGAKLYITGGIGASASGEAFGADYELPNESAYAETCGAIANVIWNDRMARLHRDVRAADIIERALYNGFLVGVSVPGDTFFYPNPLATDGVHPFNHGSPERSPWFDCACCPSNDVRAMEWIPGLIYARDERGGVHVNQYAPGVAAITVDGREVALTQETDYPWDGRIRIRVRAADGRPVAMALHLRLPGWARGEPVPGDLYRDLTPPDPAAIRCTVNEQAVPIHPQDRAVTIERPFAADDVITLDLPMPVRRVIAHDAVVADRGLVALERGPIVYCLEGVDHGGRARHIALPDGAPIEASMDAATGVVVITGHGLARHRDPTTLKVLTSDQPIRAIPYYAWNHRGATEMTVWMPRDVDDTLVPPTPTAASSGRASASHTWASDRAGAVNDQREPRRSSDETVPRFTWWDHRGTTEWLQLDFPAPTTVSRVAVYWFDDSGRGACRVPASWRLLRWSGAAWVEVETRDAFGVEPDRFNEVRFHPVETAALRIEVRLRDGFSGGVLEWRVE